jgi:hypothetical protein
MPALKALKSFDLAVPSNADTRTSGGHPGDLARPLPIPPRRLYLG